MARSVGSLFVNLVAKTAGFEKGMKRARRSLADFAKSATRYTKIAGLAIIGLGTYAVKTAAKFQTITTRLKTMLKSLQSAEKLMREINEFSTRTPFTPGELAGGATKLLAFGVGKGNVLKRLQMLGDIAAGSGARLSEVVSIFGKMKSSGTVALGDLNQLGDRAIPILETLKTQLKKTADGALKKFVSAGKLGFDDVLTALQSMTSEGGMFFGAMEAQSATLAGKLSTLMGNVELMAASFGQVLLPAVSKTVDEMSKLAVAMQGVKLSFDGVRDAILWIADSFEFWGRGWAKFVIQMDRALVRVAQLNTFLGIPGSAESLKRFQAQARAGEKAFDARLAGGLPSERFRATQIARRTEYARTRGMLINQGADSGYKPLTKIQPKKQITRETGGMFSRVLMQIGMSMRALTNAAAIGRGQGTGKRYAGLAEKGTAAGYRASISRNEPMKEMNATLKKNFLELKNHTDWLQEIARKITVAIATIGIPG